MAKQNINVGTTANDKKGDSLRAAFVKVNANFTELYKAVGLADTGQDTALTFVGSTIGTDDSSSIVIDRATTVSSNLSVGGDILPQTANGGDLGSSTLPWRSLYVSNNTIYIGGVPLGIDANGALTVNGNQIAGGGGGSTLVNGANTVSLGSDGVLTLPGGRTRIGTLLGSDAIIANEDTAFGVVAQGTNGSGVLLWIEDSENFGTSNLAAVYTNPANLGIVRIATGANGGPGPKFWDFNDSGALTFPQGTTIATADGTDAFIIMGAADKDVQIYTLSGETARGWTFGTDGSLQIPGDIKSNGNINIDINLTDSTLRRWQFGEDGDLILPAGGDIKNSTGTSVLGGGAGDSLTSNNDINITVNSEDSSSYTWNFGQTGILTAPDDIVTGTNGGRFIQDCDDGTTSMRWINVEVDDDTTQLIRAYSGDPDGEGDSDERAQIKLNWQDEDRSGLTIRSFDRTDVNSTVSHDWKFQGDGGLELPEGGVISEGGGLTGNAIKLTPAGGANANQALLIYPTAAAEGDHIHLTAGGGSTELYLGDDLHFVKLTSDGSVVIKAFDGNGAVWGFSPDGTTSIPGDIKSDGNINIDINLSDSTLRRWRFGEDGALTLPSVGKINNGAYDWTFGSTGTLALPSNGKIASGVSTAQVGSTTTIALNDQGTDQAYDVTYLGIAWTGNEAVFTTYAAGSTITFANGDVRTINDIQKNEVYDSPGEFVIDIYWSASRANLTAFPITLKTANYAAAYTAPEWQFGTNGDLEIPGNIKSEGNINIDINLADSTLRRWQFGEDGDTVFPNNISIDYGGGNNILYPRIIADSGKAFSVQGQGETGSAALAWSVDPESAGQYAQIGATKGGGDNLAKVVIQAQSNSGDGNTAKIWKFDETGALTIPGDIKSDGNINIDINLADSTLRRWHFGEDGELTVPGPISGLGNAKLDFTTYANVAYLTSTSNDTTALIMGTTSAELYAHTNILIRTNTDGTAKVWTFGDDGSLTLPGSITLTNGAVIKDTEDDAVAFGQSAGLTSQGQSAVAIGSYAGNTSQGQSAVAIGTYAGNLGQSLGAVSIGPQAGETNQGWRAIAIGALAGPSNQGQFSIAIGYGAGNGDAVANSIIINATGSNLVGAAAGFYVAPIRNISATSGVLQYNATTKEVSYSNSVTAETFNTDQITVVGNRITTTVTNANLELECNGTGGVVINTLAEATTASTARSAGYLGIPASAVSTTNTLTIADAGEHIYVTTNSQTITIPANASVSYPIGTTLTFIAGPSATTVTIAITSDTLRLAGGTSTGSRTLAANGMATAVKVAATTWYINGTGLT
jgi:hypothetical protein